MTDALRRLIAKAWRLDEAELDGLLGHLRNVAKSQPDAAERLRLIVQIHLTLAELFVDAAADEPRWLREKLPFLNGQAPLEVMQKGGMLGLMLVHSATEGMANRR